jgi:carbamoyltransferase
MIAACTHVDGTSRVQTIHRDVNPLFHRLASAFLAETGCPVLLNTSFNGAGEPIVCTPADALACAVATGLDILVLGNLLVDLRGPTAVMAP